MPCPSAGFHGQEDQMMLSKINRPAMTFALACLLTGTAWAAQRAQPRVLSNEDVESAPPPAAAPASAETAPSASAPADVPQPAAEPSETPATPSDNAHRLAAIVDAIGQASDELATRIQAGGDQLLLDRWSAMKDSLSNVLVEFRGFLDQAQAEAKQPQQAPSNQQQAAPPEQAPAQEQTQAAPGQQ
jgi:hypothetical protein